MVNFMVFSNLCNTLFMIYNFGFKCLGVWLCDFIGLASTGIIHFFLLILQVPFGPHARVGSKEACTERYNYNSDLKYLQVY